MKETYSSIWIKWKYNDHGHPDFKELEIYTFKGSDGKTIYGDSESVEEHICESGLVPTWSVRFMVERIKWHKISKPSKETVLAKIADLKSSIKSKTAKVKELQKYI